MGVVDNLAEQKEERALRQLKREISDNAQRIKALPKGSSKRIILEHTNRLKQQELLRLQISIAADRAFDERERQYG